jgi:hypothetical protein
VNISANLRPFAKIFLGCESVVLGEILGGKKEFDSLVSLSLNSVYGLLTDMTSCISTAPGCASRNLDVAVSQKKIKQGCDNSNHGSKNYNKNYIKNL